MSVTAEGVETEAQLRWLAKEGCDRQQGFLIGPPLSSKETIQFIDRVARDPPIVG
jgi:EAL domain-containing protein (putative c-di-GMP-specific phosphodiesterase class I)